MSLQTRAFRIVRDVIGIVLDWNDRYLSDKEAMREITRSLLVHKEDEKNVKKFVEKKENESLEEKIVSFDKIEENEPVEENLNEILKDEEKNEETVEEKEDEIILKDDKKEDKKLKNEKHFQNIKIEKKIAVPAIIGVFFIMVMVGMVNPYEIISNLEVNTSTDEKPIQFREVSSEDSEIRTEQFLQIPSETITTIQNGTQVILEP